MLFNISRSSSEMLTVTGSGNRPELHVTVYIRNSSFLTSINYCVRACSEGRCSAFKHRTVSHVRDFVVNTGGNAKED